MSSVRSVWPFRPTLIALAIGSSSFTATAAETQPTAEETLTVVAEPASGFTPGGDQIVPAYLDGQVANGGRLGMLGEQDAHNVPFNVISFTNKLIQDQQAKTVADVVRNDAAVQSGQGFGNFAETYRVRGFDLSGDDMTFGGLSRVMPRQVASTQMVDRVEIFKGANALLNGAGSTGVGGMINLEPKHAEDLPLTRVGLDYTSSSQVGVTADVGRRFGDDNQFGVRANLLRREGDTAIDNEVRRTTLASLGLDYRGEDLRTSLDVGYQDQAYHGSRIGVNISGVDFVPKVPGNSTNFSQPWVYSNMESVFGMARAEYDVADNWTLYSGIGAQHAHEEGNYSSPKLLSADGTASLTSMPTNKYLETFSGQFGVRGNFDTGFVRHTVNVGYSATVQRDKTAWTFGSATDRTNIYHPKPIPDPQKTSGKGDYDDPHTTARTRLQSYLITDTLSLLDDKVLLTAGVRHQKVVVKGYDYDTQAESSSFEGTRWTPAYGIVVKPWQSVSLYANHIEGLMPGETAPKTAANYGQSTGIAHTKQNEVGMKLDLGRIGGSVALYEIKKPFAISSTSDGTGFYALSGEQRHRGVEVNVFGEPVLGVRLNASTSWIDPKMTKTQGGVNQGNDPVGVPHFTSVLSGEYDIPGVEGLTATAMVNHTGTQYADKANTKKLDSYTTLDLGVRYRMKVQDNDLVWRAGVDNVTNEQYWSSVESFGTYIYQGDGRTLKVSMSYDF